MKICGTEITQSNVGQYFDSTLCNGESCDPIKIPFPRQHQPVLTKSVSSLANPLTYLHDHPYSKLQQYGENKDTAIINFSLIGRPHKMKQFSFLCSLASQCGR